MIPASSKKSKPARYFSRTMQRRDQMVILQLELRFFHLGVIVLLTQQREINDKRIRKLRTQPEADSY